MLAKHGLILGLLLFGAYAWFACESPVAPRPDATPDAGPDVTTDVPVDVLSDADADVQWPPESPDEIDITTQWTSGFTAYYPYVYYHFVTWDPVEEKRHAYLYAYHVKNRTTELLVHYNYSPQWDFFYVHEPSRFAYWIGMEHYKTGLAFPEYRYYYKLLRLSLDTHEMEVMITANFYTENCERNKGILYLISYEPRSRWMILQCKYNDGTGVRLDSWRANAETGEIQYIVNGQDRFASFPDKPNEFDSTVLSGRTNGWVEMNGWIAQGPPHQYEVWDVSASPRLILSLEFPSNTMSSSTPMNLEGWFTYSVLDPDRQRLVAHGINVYTLEEMAFPAVPYNQFQPNQIRSDLPHLWSWVDAGTRITPFGDCVMPAGSVEDIILWDRDRDIQRRVTDSSKRYGVPFLIPGEPLPRTLVYMSFNSSGEDIRLHMRDLVAAGILDETGHLLPE